MSNVYYIYNVADFRAFLKAHKGEPLLFKGLAGVYIRVSQKYIKECLVELSQYNPKGIRLRFEFGGDNYKDWIVTEV